MLQRSALIAALLLLPSLLLAGPIPEWHTGFDAPPSGLGLDGDPRALLHHNDSVYCGGSFSQAGTTTSWFVSRLDDSFGTFEWINIGDLNNRIDAMVAWGDSVLAGGRFTLADGVTVNRVAVYDGADWHPVGTPGAWSWSNVLSLTMHDGLPWAAGTDFVVRWTGSGWVDAVGAGLNGDIFALESFDGDVYMAGAFNSVPNLSGEPTITSNIARWDGAVWQAVGSGLDDTGYAMTEWQGNLVVGGVFSSPAPLLAKWSGTNWTALGAGVVGQFVTALAPWGGRIVVGGDLSGAGSVSVSDVALFDGAVWSAMGDGVDGIVRAISAKERDVVVGGGFTMSGVVASSHIGVWVDPAVGVEDFPEPIMLSAWPNPFNPATTIRFSLSTSEWIRLDIHDMAGRRIRTLLNGFQMSGMHDITWNGCDDNGRSQGSGTYLLRMQTPKGEQTHRLSLVK